MDVSPSTRSAQHSRPIPDTVSAESDQTSLRQLARWGGTAGLVGVVLMLVTFAVVIGLDLPDASDPETLTDFADIETGRIFEHLFYLGALTLFTLHALALYQLLRNAQWAAALFGTALSTVGLTIMSASSLLHISTSPLAELYTDGATPPEEQPAIEYAWHGAQSVFDSMLATGVLLVPIGIVLLGVAMQRSREYGRHLAWVAIVLGVIGVAGAIADVVDQSLEFTVLSVLAIVVFHLAAGWRTLHLGRSNATSESTADRETIGTQAR